MSAATVFNIQHFSVHDGPGIRTTVFMKGCPLSCVWCHNPESGAAKPELTFKPERCLACGECLAACPVGLADSITSRTAATHDRSICLRCGQCVDVCPAEARELLGRSVSVQEVLEEVLNDRTFYAASDGGVTISGGEPLAAGNEPFVLEFLDACRDNGLHVAVDTCGYVDGRYLLKAAARADLVLFDLKMMNPERHRRATGVDNTLILENLKSLSACGSDMWIRVPLIPGWTDDDDNLTSLADFVCGLPGRHPVHLLPYHAAAQDKYGRLGLSYELGSLKPPSADAMAGAADRMRLRGLDVRIGG